MDRCEFCSVQLLPLEELYTPAINICVRDNRQFGRKPIVGVHSVKSLQPYRRQPVTADADLDTDKPPFTGQLRFCFIATFKPKLVGDRSSPLPSLPSPFPFLPPPLLLAPFLCPCSEVQECYPGNFFIFYIAIG